MQNVCIMDLVRAVFAGTWFDTSALVTNVRNFPNHRGLAVGVLKSFLGLSSSIYTSIYVALFQPDAVRFLLMLAIVPPVLGLLLSAALNYVPYVEASEQLHPNDFSWSSTERRWVALAAGYTQQQHDLNMHTRFCHLHQGLQELQE